MKTHLLDGKGQEEVAQQDEVHLGVTDHEVTVTQRSDACQVPRAASPSGTTDFLVDPFVEALMG